MEQLISTQLAKLSRLLLYCRCVDFFIVEKDKLYSLLYSWLIWLTVIMILCQKKTALEQAKINLCHFIYLFFNEQTRLKIRENLRTSSLEPKFTRSNKKGQHRPFVWKTSYSFMVVQFGFQVGCKIVYRFWIDSVHARFYFYYKPNLQQPNRGLCHNQN